MKKIIILLLAVLPIFLIVVISFAGRIFSEVSHISVENVVFVDKTENKHPDTFIVQLYKGEEYQLFAKVYPELASNKKVSYLSSDLNVCTVDEKGLVKAVGDGIAFVSVKTDEMDKTDRIMIQVTTTTVESVRILDGQFKDIENIEMSINDQYKFNYDIEPLTTKNKNVNWSSSNPNVVTVNSRGILTAIAPGTAIITVTTVDGGLTDQCTVTVNDEKSKLSFNFDSNPDIVKKGEVYTTPNNEINLKNYLVYDESIVNPEDIILSMPFGEGDAILDSTTGILKILTPYSRITIKAELKDGSSIIEIQFVYEND